MCRHSLKFIKYNIYDRTQRVQIDMILSNLVVPLIINNHYYVVLLMNKFWDI